MKRKWMIGFGILGMVFLFLSAMATGGGHGTIMPALILTPFFWLAMLTAVDDSGAVLLYVLPSIALYVFYGWLIGSVKSEKYKGLLWVAGMHAILVAIAFVLRAVYFPDTR